MDDGFTLNANGSATLVIAGKSYTLPAPNFGQFREFSTLNEKRIEVEFAQMVEDVDETEPAKVEGEPAGVTASRQALDRIRAGLAQRDTMLLNRFAFWRDAAKIFGVTLPADDEKLPPWLGHPDLIDKIVNHWIDFPFQAPGAQTPGATAG